MQSIYKTSKQQRPEIPRLALKPKEAAIALGMSEKTLWSLTQPRGNLPCVRIGSRVLYPTHLLRKHLNREAVRQQCEADRRQTTTGEGNSR